MRASRLVTRFAFLTVAAAIAWPSPPTRAQTAPTRPKKHVLAWADVRWGYQHDSISHAIATLEHMGYASGDFDVVIRTDSQPITKHDILFKTGTGIATGEQFLARNLNYFDAIFFFGVREIELTAEQKTDLLSFVKDDGKGLVVAHSGATAFFSWPEWGEMVGGRFDEHPWGITDGDIVLDDPKFPAVAHFPARVRLNDEFYQIKEFSREKLRVVAHLDTKGLDMTKPLVHRTDGDFAAAWAKTYGKGRVFYSILGHSIEAWDNPLINTMYFEALRWSMGLTNADLTPLPKK